jgi:integrase
VTSVFRDTSRNGYRLQVWLRGNRQVLWLGDVSKTIATKVAAHVQELKMAAELRVSPDKSTSQWATHVDERIHNKLADWGLVERRGTTAKSLTLSALCQQHIDAHEDWSPGHRVWMVRCKDQMVATLGDLALDKLTEWHAKQFLRATEKRYSQATVAKHIQRARQLLSEGEQRYFDRNPFEAIKVQSTVNKERQAYVTEEVFAKVLAQIADLEVKAILVLARFGGMRVPSEPYALRWEDIKKDRIVVRSQKLKRYQDKYVREVPLFPQVKKALRSLDKSTEFVINFKRNNSYETILRTHFERAIKAAGQKQWPRLMVTLRASCRTDLLKDHPEHVVNAWLGHDAKVGDRHYNRVTDADFAKVS